MSIGQGSISYTNAPAAAQGSLPGVSVPFVSFAVDDGQVGSPTNGQTAWIVSTFQGQSIFNKQLLVIREGIELLYKTPVAVNMIRRYNFTGFGGWSFQPASGLFFFSGDRYQVFITGINNTIEV